MIKDEEGGIQELGGEEEERVEGNRRWEVCLEYVRAEGASCYFLGIPNSYQSHRPLGKDWRTTEKGLNGRM